VRSCSNVKARRRKEKLGREVDAMSSKAALLKEIQSDRVPDNPLACFAMADLLVFPRVQE